MVCTFPPSAWTLLTSALNECLHFSSFCIKRCKIRGGAALEAPLLSFIQIAEVFQAKFTCKGKKVIAVWIIQLNVLLRGDVESLYSHPKVLIKVEKKWHIHNKQFSIVCFDQSYVYSATRSALEHIQSRH